LTSSTLTNDYCSDQIENLELIIQDRTPELLAKKLNISIADASAIRSLEFDNYDEQLKKLYKDKDTVVLGRPFRIITIAYNNTVFDTLQKALVSYLEHNEYALKRKNIKLMNLQLMKSKIDVQLKQIDSLKSVVTANLTPRGSVSGFVFGQPIDPVNVYKQEIDLVKDKLEIDKEISLIDNIQVVQDYSPREVPDNPKLKKLMIAGFLFFGFLSLLVAFRLERKNLSGI
jgi:hypothetical protein